MLQNKQTKISLLKYLVCFLGVLASLTSCNQKTKSDDAEFKVVPESPRVYDGDTKVNGTDFKGPWFNFRIKMNNKTQDVVTVTALVLKVYAEDETGKMVSSDVSFSPGEFNKDVIVYTDIDNDGTLDSVTVKCEYNTFGTWQASDGGTDKELCLSRNSDCSPSDPCTRTPVFFIGNGKKGKSGSNFSYRIDVKPQGWFGTYADPTDRFDTTFSFSTQ